MSGKQALPYSLGGCYPGGKAVTAVTAKNHLKFVFKNHDMFGRNMKKMKNTYMCTEIGDN